MSEILLSDPGQTLAFTHAGGRLALAQMRRGDGSPLLSGDGPVGNPITMQVLSGEHQGLHGAGTFHVTGLTSDERSLLAYLAHDPLPLLFALQVEVDGGVATWRGQAAWNGDTLQADRMAALSAATRPYYDLCPEIADAPLSDRAMAAENCLAELFDAVPAVVTVGNATPQPVSARVRVPISGSILFDCVDARRVPIHSGEAALDLAPWEFRAFEARAGAEWEGSSR